MKIMLLPLLGLLALASCKKDEVSFLPEATQEGKGTAGCLVDGKAWTAEWRSSFSMGTAFTTSWYKTSSGKNLKIALSRVNSKEGTHIYFFLPDIRRPGTFQLNQYADPMLTSSNPPYVTYSRRKPSPSTDYYTSPQATGTLTITRLDTVARVVAGTFELNPADASSQVVQITQGRFDLPLQGY